MADNWMTPEHEAAALEGFLSNPVAVAYAATEAKAALPRQPATKSESVRVVDTDGVWRLADPAEVIDAQQPGMRWHPIPGVGMEIREAVGAPRLRWYVRPIATPDTKE